MVVAYDCLEIVIAVVVEAVEHGIAVGVSAKVFDNFSVLVFTYGHGGSLDRF